MSRYALDDTRTAWQRSGFPLTIGIIAAKFVMLVLTTLGVPLAAWLICMVPEAWSQPWRVFTYSWVSFDIMDVIFSGITLYFFGGSLERSWGTRTFAIFFAAISFITAAGMSLAAWWLHSSFFVASWLVVAALVVAWGMLNPFEKILFWFVPIEGRIVALIDVLIIFFTHVQVSFVLALGALSGCAASYLWVKNRTWGNVTHWTIRRPARAAKPRRPRDDAFSWRDLNPFERIARARRKKQFQRLFEDDK